MQPLAPDNNCRLILVNRRDYPGSKAFTDVERAQLAAVKTASDTDALLLFKDYMRDQITDILEFLSAFIKQENIPLANSDHGGIILCGWSLGGSWITALLANLDLTQASQVNLGLYIRRTVLYGELKSALLPTGCLTVDRSSIPCTRLPTSARPISPAL